MWSWGTPQKRHGERREPNRLWRELDDGGEKKRFGICRETFAAWFAGAWPEREAVRLFLLMIYRLHITQYGLAFAGTTRVDVVKSGAMIGASWGCRLS
jgi:hypothetical protein